MLYFCHKLSIQVTQIRLDFRY